jgi:hypothetical protein
MNEDGSGSSSDSDSSSSNGGDGNSNDGDGNSNDGDGNSNDGDGNSNDGDGNSNGSDSESSATSDEDDAAHYPIRRVMVVVASSDNAPLLHQGDYDARDCDHGCGVVVGLFIFIRLKREPNPLTIAPLHAAIVPPAAPSLLSCGHFAHISCVNSWVSAPKQKSTKLQCIQPKRFGFFMNVCPL